MMNMSYTREVRQKRLQYRPGPFYRDGTGTRRGLLAVKGVAGVALTREPTTACSRGKSMEQRQQRGSSTPLSRAGFFLTRVKCVNLAEGYV